MIKQERRHRKKFISKIFCLHNLILELQRKWTASDSIAFYWKITLDLFKKLSNLWNIQLGESMGTGRSTYVNTGSTFTSTITVWDQYLTCHKGFWLRWDRKNKWRSAQCGSICTLIKLSISRAISRTFSYHCFNISNLLLRSLCSSYPIRNTN